MGIKKSSGTVKVSNAASITLGSIEGKAAHDAAASGNPVQVGGVYRVTDPAVADGDAASLRVNAKGELLASLTGSNIPEETLTVYRAGPLAANTEEAQLDLVSKHVRVTALEFAFEATADAYGYLLIKPYKSDGTLETNPVWSLQLSGATGDYITPGKINTNKSGIFEYLGSNKIGLKAGVVLDFANGVKISVKNNHGSTAYNAGFNMSYVKNRK